MSMTHDVTNLEVPSDMELENVTTAFSDDCSSVKCTLLGKNGREVNFCADLPTGPQVRAIRQTIEIRRAEDTASQNEDLDSTGNVAERFEKLLGCGPSLVTDKTNVVPDSDDALSQLGSFQHLSQEEILDVSGVMSEIDELQTSGDQFQNSSLEVQVGEPTVVVQTTSLPYYIERARTILQEVDEELRTIHRGNFALMREEPTRQTMLSMRWLLECRELELAVIEHLLTCLGEMLRCANRGDEEDFLDIVLALNQYIQRVAAQYNTDF